MGCRVLFGGVGVDVVGEDEAVRRILDLSSSGDLEVVVTPMSHHIVLYGQDRRVRLDLRPCQPRACRWERLVAVSRLLRLPLRQKVSGSDLLEPLAAAAAHRGVRIYLLARPIRPPLQSSDAGARSILHRSRRACSPRYDDEFGPPKRRGSGGIGGRPAKLVRSWYFSRSAHRSRNNSLRHT